MHSTVKLTSEESQAILQKIQDDATAPLRKHYGFKLWILVLSLGMVGFGFAYFLQLRDGLGVTNLNDYVSWGLYLSNFVFWVATSLVGMLISSVLGLLNQKWITPISRIAEIVALGFVSWAGLVIVFDMGRPDRLQNVFLHGRLQSPIVWDLTVVLTYTTISALLLLLPMIPDMALLRNREKNLPKWQWKLFNVLSFGYMGTPEQYKHLHKLIRMLLILVIPVAISIHTVTSWLFASTLRAGWDSTILGPYFVAGAFPAGVGMLIVVLFFINKYYKLKDHITDFHFDKLARLLVLVSLVYLYFNINEYLVPAYKMRKFEGHHIESLFNGEYSPLFYFTQIVGLILPIILLLFKRFRKPNFLVIIAICVVVGAYIKRMLIIIPTMQHPYLPMQYVPESWHHYSPSLIEWVIAMGSFVGTILTITILAKVLPVIPIVELAEEQGVSSEEIFGQPQQVEQALK